MHAPHHKKVHNHNPLIMALVEDGDMAFTCGLFESNLQSNVLWVPTYLREAISSPNLPSRQDFFS